MCLGSECHLMRNIYAADEDGVWTDLADLGIRSREAFDRTRKCLHLWLFRFKRAQCGESFRTSCLAHSRSRANGNAGATGSSRLASDRANALGGQHGIAFFRNPHCVTEVVSLKRMG